MSEEMQFHPDIDQRALITDAFARPLDELLPIERLHKDGAAEPWAPLAELGIFGIAAPEEIGGVGLGPVEETLLAIELGRRLAGPAIIGTLLAGHAAAADLREGIVAGRHRVAPAIDRTGVVTALDADGADHLLVMTQGSARIVAAPAAPVPLDDHYWTAALGRARDDVAAPAGDPAADLRIRLLLAAALVGLAQRALAMAVDYAKLREQFGHAIGGFQAVKHHCANMATAALAAGDLTTFAAVALAEARPDAAFQIETALLLAIDAALGNARKNVQIHGGIGFSEEADPHLIVKRAHLLVELAGGSEAAADRVALAQAPLR